MATIARRVATPRIASRHAGMPRFMPYLLILPAGIYVWR